MPASRAGLDRRVAGNLREIAQRREGFDVIDRAGFGTELNCSRDSHAGAC